MFPLANYIVDEFFNKGLLKNKVIFFCYRLKYYV